MPNTTCQAKVAALCRYHGSGSEYYASMLRSTLEVAGEAYKAAQNTPTAYAAFVTLREAQKAFYATDTGLAEISSILSNTSLNTFHREEIEKVHKAALETRARYEKELNIHSLFPPATPTRYQELPQGATSNDSNTNNISTFPGKNPNEICQIDWSATDGAILLRSSMISVEHQIIGQALSHDEATRKATEWYNRSFLKK